MDMLLFLGLIPFGGVNVCTHSNDAGEVCRLDVREGRDVAVASVAVFTMLQWDNFVVSDDVCRFLVCVACHLLG